MENSSDLERGPGPQSITAQFSISTPLLAELQRGKNHTFPQNVADNGSLGWGYKKRCACYPTRHC